MDDVSGILGASDVPAIVRAVMQAEGLKQGQLARKAGVSQSTVSKWLAGVQEPNMAQWSRVVRLALRNPETRHMVAIADESVSYLPLISWVSAGKLTDAESQIPVQDAPILGFVDLGHGEFFALKVEGDSMNRVSPEGSVIVVNRLERQLINGKCYIFSLRGETTFKRWNADPGYLEPDSTNPLNKPIFLKKSRDFDVVGRVLRTVLDL